MMSDPKKTEVVVRFDIGAIRTLSARFEGMFHPSFTQIRNHHLSICANKLESVFSHSCSAGILSTIPYFRAGETLKNHRLPLQEGPASGRVCAWPAKRRLWWARLYDRAVANFPRAWRNGRRSGLK
jgi:hypothetical protein